MAALLLIGVVWQLSQPLARAQWTVTGVPNVVHDGSLYNYQYSGYGPGGGYDDYYVCLSTGDWVWVDQSGYLWDSSGHTYGPGYDYQNWGDWHGYFAVDENGVGIWGIPYGAAIAVLSPAEFIGADPYVVYIGNTPPLGGYTITPYFDYLYGAWVTYTTPNAGYCRIGASWYWFPGALPNAQAWAFGTVIDATYLWPGPNIFAVDPPQQVYLNGQAYNLATTNVNAGGQYYSDTLYYQGSTGYVDIQRNAASGSTTASSIWGVGPNGSAFSATFNPDTWAVGPVASNLAINFSAPGGTSTYGPALVSWDGYLLQFYYTTGDGKDVYWNGGSGAGDYTVIVGQDDSVVAIHGAGQTAGSYDPDSSEFDFAGAAAMGNFFALDSSGNPLGLPTGLTMLFGAPGIGNSLLLQDGNAHTPNYTFRTPGGNYGVKYVGLPPNKWFLISDSGSNYNSQIYLTTTAGMLINEVSGWPVANSYPAQLYVNGVICPLHWDTNYIGGTGQNTYGGASYISADNTKTVTLSWAWSGGPTWTWSMNSQSGAWDHGNAFSNMPSGTLISVNPPPSSPSYGPASLVWNGSALGFVGWESQLVGADIYEGNGTRWMIYPSGVVVVTDISSGNTLYTGTYNASTHLFSFVLVNFGSVSALDSSGNVLATSTPLLRSGLRLWLAADSGVTLDGSGGISSWNDQGDLGNNATQANGSYRPTVTANGPNGKPAAHFDAASSQFLNLLPNLMNQALSGEAIVVLKNGSAPNRDNGLWNFGNYRQGTLYPASTSNNGWVQDDFGINLSGFQTSLPGTKPVQDISSQFHVYDISIQADHVWQNWIDGVPLFRSTADTVSFNSAPVIGYTSDWSNLRYFSGDIAEVLIYDHALSDADRETVSTYLARKYALGSLPVTPTIRTASKFGVDQAVVSWTNSVSDNVATRFVVERRDGAGGAFLPIATVTKASFIDSGLAPDVQYTYRVYATTWAGASSYSAAAALVNAGTNAVTFPTGGLCLWLMADGTCESKIGEWPDYSSQGNNAFQVNVNRPTVVPDTLNGKPVAHFDSSLFQSLQLTNIMGVQTTQPATAGEAIAVLKSSPVATKVNALWSLGGGTSYPAVDGTINVAFGGGSSGSVDAPSQSITDFHILNVHSEYNLWETTINGVPLNLKTTNSFSFTKNPLLGVSGSSFNGDIAEFLVFNRVLNSEERDSVMAYLSQKYALVAAPSTPTNLKAIALNGNSSLITWTPQIANAAIDYLLWRTDDSVNWTLVASLRNCGTCFDANLNPNKNYSYKVQAVNWGGASQFSTSVALNRSMIGVGDFPGTGLRTWMMADGIASATVNFWPDASGSENNAIQAVKANRPTLVSNVLNGEPVVRFDASQNQFLKLTDLMHGSPSAAAGEALIVVASAQGASNNGLWNMGASGSSFYNANGTIIDDFGMSSGYQSTTTTQDLTQFHLYDVSSSQNGEWKSRLDGDTLFSGAGNTVGFTNQPLLGKNNWYGGATCFSGDIAEVLVFDHVLSISERRTVQQYLAIKYLLASFDVDGDGLNTGQELVLGTNPLNSSTNGSGILDGIAVNLGLNPLVPFVFYPDPNGPPPNNPPASDSGTAMKITLIEPAGVVLQP